MTEDRTHAPSGSAIENDRPRRPSGVGISIPSRSVGLKLILVCGLALIMAIPALFVYGVVHERTSGASEALRDVSARVGGEQDALGPVLALPFTRAPDSKDPDRKTHGIAIAYAERGTVDANVLVEEKKRGIYIVPIYDATLDFEAVFNPDDLLNALPAGATPEWSDARLYLGLSDNRGFKEEIIVKVDGKSIAVEPAAFRSADTRAYSPTPAFRSPLAAGEIPNLENRTKPFTVEATLRFSGAQRLGVGPFAQNTTMSLESNWDAPSFTGGVLPREHNADDDTIEGFKATWTVPYLARNIPGSGAYLNLAEVGARDRNDMALRFINAASPYQSVERALKYAVMFIGLVFLSYFLFEVTSNARAHPAQYVLVGLSQSIFYLLLLALAERVGFNGAFFVSASMTVLLTSGYAMAVFRSKQYGLRSFGVLSGIYGLVFTLMRASENALLAGALASFVAIAVTMYLTRNVDWYGDRTARAA